MSRITKRGFQAAVAAYNEAEHEYRDNDKIEIVLLGSAITAIGIDRVAVGRA